MVHGAWCMVHGAWCMVHGAWCTFTWKTSNLEKIEKIVVEDIELLNEDELRRKVLPMVITVLRM